MTTPHATLDEAIAAAVSKRFKLDPAIAGKALQCMAGGSPVPYLARYKREAVGGLDERTLYAMRREVRRAREFEQRRQFILRAIGERSDVPAKLRSRIERCSDRLEMENLYLPYRPSRRTRGSIAAEKGLKGLADALLSAADIDPAAAAADYAGKEGVGSPEEALQGASDILAERFAIDPEIRLFLIHLLRKEGVLEAGPAANKSDVPARYSQFKNFKEKLGRIPSHRFLALQRAEKEGAIATRVSFPTEKLHAEIAKRKFPADCAEPLKAILDSAADYAAKRLLAPSVSADVLADVKERADSDATELFCKNLYDLLRAPPAGPQRILGCDPAVRGAVHIACIDERGEPLAHAKLRPFAKDEAKRAEAAAEVVRLCRTHEIKLVALGNGPGRHECAGFLQDSLDELDDAAPSIVVVNEVGLGTYASGPVGRSELPAFPVPARAAISLARRLSDPLREFVKLEAKQIGFGQYQSEVDGTRLAQALNEVVEHCVNEIGADLNRAPMQQLAKIAGFTTSRARAVVEHREKAGAFRNRAALAELPVMTPEAFAQSAGFVRVMDGDTPLDSTGVHPADYEVVERIAQKSGVSAADLIANADPLNAVDVDEFADESHSAVEVAGVLSELLKGPRDPRPVLQVAQRTAGVKSVADLKAGLRLSGRVTNVTAFGAFIDVGVKQDGLVHVSELSDGFVKDPSTVVHVGQVVQVRVLGVDSETKRIALSMKSGRSSEGGGRGAGGRGGGERGRGAGGGGGRGGPGGSGGGARGGGGRGGGGRGPGRGGDRGRRGRRDESYDRADLEAVRPEAPKPVMPEPSANPVPEGMTEEEFVKAKLEELRKRFK
ncbi:MAG: Tex-like N-terminal domain-containing protein [Planctomycetota bacterium]